MASESGFFAHALPSRAPGDDSSSEYSTERSSASSEAEPALKPRRSLTHHTVVEGHTPEPTPYSMRVVDGRLQRQEYTARQLRLDDDLDDDILCDVKTYGRAAIIPIDDAPSLYVSNTVVIGNNNNVFGDNNMLVGNNNAGYGHNLRSRGDRNKLFGTYCTNYDTGSEGKVLGAHSVRIGTVPTTMHVDVDAEQSLKIFLPLSVSDKTPVVPSNDDAPVRRFSKSAQAALDRSSIGDEYDSANSESSSNEKKQQLRPQRHRTRLRKKKSFQSSS